MLEQLGKHHSHFSDMLSEYEECCREVRESEKERLHQKVIEIMVEQKRRKELAQLREKLEKEGEMSQMIGESFVKGACKLSEMGWCMEWLREYRERGWKLSRKLYNKVAMFLVQIREFKKALDIFQ